MREQANNTTCDEQEVLVAKLLHPRLKGLKNDQRSTNEAAIGSP